jgi:CheY-like chemotaxis protein
VSVRDTGRGIPSDVLPRVFEPFFTTKGVGEGTGLGLAMVYGIVQQNQGHVELQSIVGRGTAARVRLPVVPAPSDLPTVVTPDGAVSGGSETILLVEDENIVRLLAVQLLSRLGYQVVVAERPRAALAIAQQLTQPIDLLVTDVVMPEMNGQDLYHEIVKVRPGLRVLYMSGYAPTGTLDTEVMEEGAVFLPKPFTMKQMADAIRDSLNTTVTVAR